MSLSMKKGSAPPSSLPYFPTKYDPEAFDAVCVRAGETFVKTDVAVKKSDSLSGVEKVMQPYTFENLWFLYEQSEAKKKADALDAEKRGMDALIATGGRTDNLEEAVTELENKGLIENVILPPEEKTPTRVQTDAELAKKVSDGIYKMYSLDMLPACCVFPGGPCGMLPAYCAATCYYHVPVVGSCCKPVFNCCIKPRFICHCRAPWCCPWMSCSPSCNIPCNTKTVTCQLGEGKTGICAMTCVKICFPLPCYCLCPEAGLLPIDKVIEGYEPVATEPWQSKFKLPAAPSNLVIGRYSEPLLKEKLLEQNPTKGKLALSPGLKCGFSGCLCVDCTAKGSVKAVEGITEGKMKKKETSTDRVLPPNTKKGKSAMLTGALAGAGIF
jgi:hypothetical protein